MIAARTRTRRFPAVVCASVLFVGACASDAEDATSRAGGGSSTTTAGAPSTTTTTPPPATGEFPAQPEGVDWPTADWPTGDLSADVDGAAIEATVQRAFGELSDDSGRIDAVLAVQGGRLVLERYNGWNPDEPHNSWSMAKSINSALVGILVREGEIDVSDPFPAPEWQAAGDERAAITWDQLLRMSSGLEWDEDYGDPAGDVVATLGPDNDRGGYAASKPLAAEPGSTWVYSTGTANLLARGVADIVGHGDALTSWIQRELFDPLGIAGARHNVDRTGVISGGSFIDLTPRDFARFGLLYLRGGEWDGRRILPEGWVDYSRTPTPSNPEGTYGAQWWLMPERPGVLYASGFNGQSITVVPEHDLVVVVLSNAGDDRDEQVRTALLAAFGA